MGPEDQVRALVEPLLADQGVELVDLTLGGGVLDLRVDTPAGGIDLDTIARVTQSVSRLLDERDPIPGRYTLEVSSPGLERPLRTPAHYRRFVGTTVSVKTHAHVEGERRAKGILEAADDEGFVVVDAESGPRRLSYSDVERARTVFEWGPTPKPGSKPKKQTTKKATSS